MGGSELLTNFLKEPVVMHLTQISGLDLKGITLPPAAPVQIAAIPFSRATFKIRHLALSLIHI